MVLCDFLRMRHTLPTRSMYLNEDDLNKGVKHSGEMKLINPLTLDNQNLEDLTGQLFYTR